MSRVLVIDDDAKIRRLIRRSLERINLVVDEAENGEQGLRQFVAEPADLVICDINMPEKNGLETIIHLRRSAPLLPILAISGGISVYGMDYLPDAATFGAAWTLRKPFSVADVQGVVMSILAKPKLPPNEGKKDRRIG
ncbi:MAG: response regulator [Planctomycetota bacterium]|nr:response regulator [Planctomycetota bacterium]